MVPLIVPLPLVRSPTSRLLRIKIVSLAVFLSCSFMYCMPDGKVMVTVSEPSISLSPFFEVTPK
ncbi:hypothetical protein D3C80_2199580 [compost metagenome]